MNLTRLPSISDSHRIQTSQLDPPARILLGPGPSNSHPRVTQALIAPQVGHLDPTFLPIMDETQELLRYTWQTSNELTLPISGTGSAAMEAAVANVVEPGDVVLVGVNGYFGERLCTMAERYGADVRRMEKPWGEVFSLEEINSGLATHEPSLLALIHAETSTGAAQPLEGVGQLCHEFGALLLVDTVTSMGGVPLFLDAWEVDIAYSCSQKCLGCPPGLAPLTMSEMAMEKRVGRQSRIGSWYFDVVLLSQYWGWERKYHHTTPISMIYGLREGLRLIAEEGLSERWQRHRNNAELFWIGLQDLRLECHVEHTYRLPSLTTIRVPRGVDAAAVSRYILDHYNIEIAGGLGELAGKVWRVGLMGFNSRAENVQLLLRSLEEALLNAR